MAAGQRSGSPGSSHTSSSLCREEMTHCRCDWPYLRIGVSVHTYRSGQWKYVKENAPYLTADRTQDTDRTPIHTLCIGASWPSSFPVQVILKESSLLTGSSAHILGLQKICWLGKLQTLRPGPYGPSWSLSHQPRCLSLRSHSVPLILDRWRMWPS